MTLLASFVRCFLRRPGPLLALLVITIAPVDSHAQLSGLIRIFGGTQTQPSCYVLDNGPAMRTVFVRLLFNGGSTAVRFRIEPSPGATLTLVSESHPIAGAVGDVTSGISICFAPCTGGILELATVTYMTYGTSTACSQLRIVPHPNAQTVEQIDCLGFPKSIPVQDLVIFRELGDCLCPDARSVPGTPTMFDCSPVAIAATTWGAIKALYR
jgi:hypothetical protein